MTEEMDDCEVCGCKKAIYVCPSCSRKSCSAACVKQHKIDYSCDGRTKRVEFVPKEKLANAIAADLRLLVKGEDEIGRVKRIATSIESERGSSKTSIKVLKRLVVEAKKVGSIVTLMPSSMDKHKRNTSRYDPKTSSILWRIEWLVDGQVVEVTKSADSKTELRSLLPAQLLNKVVCASLEIKGGSLVPVDIEKTLQDALQEQNIVEFPCFHLQTS